MCCLLPRTHSTDETTAKRRDTVGSLSRWDEMCHLDVYSLLVKYVKIVLGLQDVLKKEKKERQ